MLNEKKHDNKIEKKFSSPTVNTDRNKMLIFILVSVCMLVG